MKILITFVLIVVMLSVLSSLSVASAPAEQANAMLLGTPGSNPTATSPALQMSPFSPAPTQPQPIQPLSTELPLTQPLPTEPPPTEVPLPDESVPFSPLLSPPIETSDGWTVLANGIDYRQYYLSGPVKVYVARMAITNTQTTIETSLANGRLNNNGLWQQIANQAVSYDGALNTWGRTTGQTWNLTNKVVVAINGSYFDKLTYLPLWGVVSSGWYAKRVDQNIGPSFVWNYNRQVYISDCATYYPLEQNEQSIKFADKGTMQQISGVNQPRGDNQLIVYTPQFDTNTHTNPDGVEVVVEMSSPAMVYSYSERRIITGTIETVREGAGSTLIPYDSIVLSASGSAAAALKNNAVKGEKIGIYQEVVDCSSSTSGSFDWNKTYASISGDFHFLNAGSIKSFPGNLGATNYNPRTAIGYNQSYVYFIVVDGRTQQSVGMTIAQLATFSRDTLGITDAMALDSGGSSTMWVNGNVVNRPSDCRLVYMPVVNTGPLPEGSPTPTSSPPIPINSGSMYSTCARSVPDGLMMVIPQSTPSSTKFAPGNTVTPTSKTNLRLGPGTNYGVITIIDPGTGGTILHDANNLDGVYAKGNYWWKVSFGSDIVGWMAESQLIELK